jgi:hypothetical protein
MCPQELPPQTVWICKVDKRNKTWEKKLYKGFPRQLPNFLHVRLWHVYPKTEFSNERMVYTDRCEFSNHFHHRMYILGSKLCLDDAGVYSVTFDGSLVVDFVRRPRSSRIYVVVLTDKNRIDFEEKKVLARPWPEVDECLERRFEYTLRFLAVYAIDLVTLQVYAMWHHELFLTRSLYFLVDMPPNKFYLHYACTMARQAVVRLCHDYLVVGLMEGEAVIFPLMTNLDSCCFTYNLGTGKNVFDCTPDFRHLFCNIKGYRMWGDLRTVRSCPCLDQLCQTTIEHSQRTRAPMFRKLEVSYETTSYLATKV